MARINGTPELDPVLFPNISVAGFMQHYVEDRIENALAAEAAAGKQPAGTGTTEKGTQPAAQLGRPSYQHPTSFGLPQETDAISPLTAKTPNLDAFLAKTPKVLMPPHMPHPNRHLKRTRTTKHDTQTQPLLLAADAFAAAPAAEPEWCKLWEPFLQNTNEQGIWPADRTIMLRRTSKRVKEVVDKMRLPAVVRLSRSFWDDARNGTDKAKLEFVLRQLAAMTCWCRITTLELTRCEMKRQDTERLAGLLAQCPALTHLDLSGNYGFGAAGAESLAGVLGQCTALTHLNLGYNRIGNAGAERLTGALAQCTALAHLDLSYSDIRDAGAEFLAGLLGQYASLAYLNLSCNNIGAGGKGRLRASWRCEASGLVLPFKDSF